MKIIDCQLLAGSGLVAAKSLDFQIQGRMSNGFGDDVVQANKQLLGDIPIWGANFWKPLNGDVVAGCPPCSGWSQLNFRGRGAHAAAHKYTWDLIRYAASCNNGKGPKVVVWECVQAAYREGSALMQEYFDYLCSATGSKYTLTNVLMSGASVGSASERKRYFWVASKVPFGVSVPDLVRPVTVGDRLYTDPVFTPDVLGTWPHSTILHSDQPSKILQMVVDTHRAAGWHEGWTLRDAAFHLLKSDKLSGAQKRRYFDDHGCWIGFPGPKILDSSKPCPVITGGAAADFLHPTEHRFLTVYEFGRLMGYPKDWVWPGTSVRKTVELIGKGVPVESWHWVLNNIKQSLEGNPGALRGSVVDVTYAWQGLRKIKISEQIK